MSKRPTNQPRDMKFCWPGLGYPRPTGVQARVKIDGRVFSKYFNYLKYEGDRNPVVAAHEAAEKWLNRMKKKRNKPMPWNNGVTGLTRRRK